jgi:hypothetical protein
MQSLVLLRSAQAGTLNVQHVLKPCCVLPALHWLTMTPMQVLVIKTDGGPDRNNTFINVQLAYYSLAKELGLDKLILMRTAPGQSYVNPVERVMSVLNLALQGFATARGECSPAVELALKGAQSMKATRVALSKAGTHVAGAALSPAEEWAAAMQIPIDIVATSFKVCLPAALLHCTQQACNVNLSCCRFT